MTKFIALLFAAALMALAPFTMAQEKKSFWHVPTPTDAQHVKAAAPFTLTDYHIHLRLGTTCVKAIERQEATGIQSGILENSGREWPLFDDASLLAFIRYNRKIMAEKGGDETRETYRIKLPRNLDGIVVNLPAYLAGLPKEAWMSEFVPLTTQETVEEEVPASDEFGMEDIGDF